MFAEAVLFVVGLAALVFGADRAVTAAAEVASFYGVSPFFIGVTLISVGTSIPEMTTSIYAASYGAGDLVVGNIIGSETSQITLAIGIVALIAPIVADRRDVMVYGGAMTLAMIIMLLTLEDGVVQRSEGFLMMLAYVNFVYTLYTNEGGEEIAEEVVEEEKTPERGLPRVAFGLLLVVVGGQVMVTNGVELARLVGISEYSVGLLTGLGTTAPEIVVAGIAAKEGREGISVGSILGSNITDPVFSLGIGALVADVVVTDLASVTPSGLYMLVVSLAVLALLYWQEGIDRRAALLCLGLYLPTFVVL
ncbi:sodium:calcium antiporter [Haloferax mediterranei ATCC 33500]|uniref:Na+/Ca2+-antiporter-like protein n=1 Tax=Haloferax mediterranei (strain ATCC 33500 / DSM 1411 / JCM 8866 / NBRC 14739 / NCIMB 2177 / R-4) TaxID=523841 RepID=I3R376_HALMT|nr:sodium:calcium antiporter [Haloferax mediterranei]AFK18686.1 Na+/Ca2+-antiporter-like protein [Haloferax mediterranei ATCC 33500]AHZ21944.1 sodium:calcium antiporter [Haloferax mediterranei ATCC 33500]EMA03453.1 Na+/Ca2+-antiporter-like protein [Haloferax mediterranei ATCC 33500]MDX5988783.1 sodium:calcium antiporter [Haloferax mediterranei ATCC 33500]QCQ75186.1 sodium:calcium antiporter [Haloferax mediterranei ATCC 33500]